MDSSLQREIESQSSEIVEHIEFLRENAGLPPFQGPRATPEELFHLYSNSVNEFRELAEWNIPIFVGRCFIEELEGCWNVEDRKHLGMYGMAYVDGFGNIDYENLYLPYLQITKREDIARIERLRKQSDRARSLRDRFRQEFEQLSGETAIRKEVEARCVDLGILPDSPMRFKVERARVPKYCKELGIKLRNG